MPCITLPIDLSGRPILEVGVSPSRSVLPQNAPAPTIHWVRALADTGCTHTAIHTSVATTAGLGIIGKVPLTSSTQSVAVNLYFGDLFIRVPLSNGGSYDWRFSGRQFTEMLQPHAHFEGLLGMDIFSFGTLHVNGLTRNTTFCW